MDKLNRLVLVINSSYEAIAVCSAKRAFTLIFKGAAVVEQASNVTIHTSKMDIPVPSVIKLVNYRKVHRSTRSVSRRAIMLRDQYCCQYCGNAFEAKKLTLDHIHPKSKGGGNSWVNMVTACYGCNNRKGSRSLEEAGMTLLKKPIPLSIHARHKAFAQDDSWNDYLFV